MVMALLSLFFFSFFQNHTFAFLICTYTICMFNTILICICLFEYLSSNLHVENGIVVYLGLTEI